MRVFTYVSAGRVKSKGLSIYITKSIYEHVTCPWFCMPAVLEPAVILFSHVLLMMSAAETVMLNGRVLNKLEWIWKEPVMT